MIPPLIVRRASELGLGLIAITDHNMTENAGAVMRAAEGSGLTVLPGMELQTQEEVHLLCLFETLDQARAWQAVVDDHLPALQNNDEFFGAQFIVDETGDLVRQDEQLRLTSAAIPLDEAVDRVHDFGGLPIAAHVDRQANGLLTILGFVPPGLPLAALEISARVPPDEATRRYPQVAGWPLICSGDAHRLSEMRASTLLTLASPSLRELALALSGADDRRVKLLP